jgi:hypothetical protein
MPRRTIEKLFPCLSCARGGGAIEECISVYLQALHGQLPKRDDRGLRFLPKTCCKQPKAKVDPEAMVA